MSGPPSLIENLHAALSPHGLFVRGTLVFTDDGPRLPDGSTARAVALIGHEGSSHWPAFCRWRQSDADGSLPDPLDRWSKAVIGPLASRFQATAFFPSDPPWQPFQQWAMRAEGLRPSPLGILVHPRLGLWHGYRGALAFSEAGEGMGAIPAGDHPCDACVDKPCLSACPAGAILPEGFQYIPCRSFLASKAGGICLENGCLARAACPVGAEYRYARDQLQFHMDALKR